MRKALFIGGTGTISTAIVRKLLASGSVPCNGSVCIALQTAFGIRHPLFQLRLRFGAKLFELRVGNLFGLLFYFQYALFRRAVDLGGKAFEFFVLIQHSFTCLSARY